MEVVKQFMSRSLISAEFPDLHPAHPLQQPPEGHGAPGTVQEGPWGQLGTPGVRTASTAAGTEQQRWNRMQDPSKGKSKSKTDDSAKILPSHGR